MRKSLVLATFAVTGAGAIGLGAAMNLTGSDTLKTLTNDLTVGNPDYSGVAQCAASYPNATQINYTGGGSGLGEGNMAQGSSAANPQVIAPMSRPLEKGSGTKDPCAPNHLADGGVTTENGIVVALDGVTIVTSQLNGASVACNGPAADTDCAPNAAELAVGLAYNTTVPGALRTTYNPAISTAYTFGSWQDVLKVLYFGVVDTNFGHSSDPEVGANCNSSIRNALANNWGQIFEGGCSSAQCTQLRHLFRRDDASGTTDIFAALLGQPGPSASKNPLTPTNLGNWGLGADNFCNDLAGAGTGTEWPGSNPGRVAVNGIVPFDDQDYDPIRRPCSGKGTDIPTNNPTEQVCERGTFSGGTWSAGSLGLLLAAVDDNVAPVDSNSVSTQYATTSDTHGTHVNRCTGTTVAVAPPAVKNITGPGNTTGFCANGDISTGGFCLAPGDNNGDPNCISFSADTPPLATTCTTQGTNASNYTVCDTTAGSLNPQQVDPRVFNLYSYSFNGSTWVPTIDNSNRPMWGAYFRIHLSQAMYGGPSPNLQQNRVGSDTFAPGGTTESVMCNIGDMTHQIGCLVQASPCSVGYAGRDTSHAPGPNPNGSNGLALTQNASGLKIIGVPDNSACIQTFQYKYSRKLYLNTIQGFQQASAPELALAECESDPNVINAVGATNGFIPLPDSGTWGAIVNGKPFCEDFNEGLKCLGDAGNNVNACANNDLIGGGGLIPGVSRSTTCGNSIVEPFEDCDNGNANGAAPATCSVDCRNNF